MSGLQYGVLLYPSHNRVYFEASKQLAAAELGVAVSQFSTPVEAVRLETLGGVEYLCFDANQALSTDDLARLSRLSFAYAVFQLHRDEEALLKPVQMSDAAYLDEDIVSILKYSGKTNENFTKMMLNVAAFSCGLCSDRRLRVLDPLCGRGTTLFQALAFGFHAAGLDADKKAVHEGATFLTRYLKQKRCKHEAKQSKAPGSGTKKADIYDWRLAKTKEAYKAEDVLNVRMVRGDAADVPLFFPKASFDILVTDLPYGIQHGSGSAKNAFSRNPAELLETALPEWRKVLKAGAAAVLSWNQRVLKRNAVVQLLEAAGFEALKGGVYEQFEHRVDQAITRDLIVARTSH
jgi:SAM-dependent methyltransferase